MTEDCIDILLAQCLDGPPETRAERIAEACASRPVDAEEIRRRLQRLVTMGIVDPVQPHPDRLGPYRLLQRLGAGSMGVVYLAEEESLHRRVALKVIRGEQLFFEDVRERFRREVAAQSQLDHPNLCTVYGAGQHDGVPYLAMQYVEGASLADWISEARTPNGKHDLGSATTRIAKLCSWFGALADGLHAAHEAGLVHRDVKPANVMLTTGGVPVLLDFGLAHLVEAKESQRLTAPGAQLGTPAYMAPEQVEGDTVDRRTDVYALGAMLYECLTGRPPFEATSRESLFKQILAGEPLPAHRVLRNVPEDLSVVVQTAMARHPCDRYASAQALAEDLRRIARYEPITARRPSRWTRARRWVQRHPVATTAIALLTTGLGTALVLLGALQEQLTRTRAVALAKASFQVGTADQALSLKLALEAVRTEQTPDTVSQLQRALTSAHEAARLDHPSEHVETVAFAPDGSVVATGTGDGEVLLWSADGAGELIHSWPAHSKRVTSLRFSPEGSRLLSASRDGTVIEWTLEGTMVRQLPGRKGKAPVVAARHVGAQRLLIAEGAGRGGYAGLGKEFEISIRSFDGGPATWVTRLSTIVEGADISGDGLVAVACGDGTVQVFDSEAGTEAIDQIQLEFAAQCVRFRPDGQALAVGALDGWAFVHSLERDEVLRLPRHAGSVFDLAFSPDGRRLAVAGAGRSIRVFDESGEELLTLRGHGREVRGLHFDSTGNRLASVSWDGTGRIWELSVPGSPVLLGHAGSVGSVAFDAGGQRILTGGLNGTARLWNTDDGQEQIAPIRGRSWLAVAFAPDGSLVVGDSGEFQEDPPTSTVGFWSVDGVFQPPRIGPVGWSALQTVQVSPDGDWLLTASSGGGARLYPRDGSSFRQLGPAPDPAATSALFNATGELAIVSRWSGDVEIWQLSGDHDEPDARASSPGDPSWFAEFSPDDDRFFASAHVSGVARIWDHSNLSEPVRELRGHTQAVIRVHFAPDGTGYLTASFDGTARLWDKHGVEVARLAAHDSFLWDATYSRDGSRIATASSDGKVRVWWADTEDLIDAAEHRVRAFTDEERTRYGELLRR